ncbi:MAG: bifunctional methylenetetrahydrofolate dehydrogenase/methenyltetrahydrofolate cyclohydrolase FolD [Bdellovibrionales bacterium]|nr:bifunctional methylenetetrahydrofolate dehydrogenase/methenyltetrahydrofolate cyclohydrolase FolD [Bdellovibrionales bacterium]
MQILSGKKVSASLREALKVQAVKFQQKAGRPPGLGVILVGEDPASQVYVRNKFKACEEVGFQSFEERLPNPKSIDEVLALVEKLNENPEVDGFLVQLPLPDSKWERAVLDKIDPAKDADGLTAENVGLLWLDRARVLPCTPAGVIEILKFYGHEMARKNAVVVGRSQIVGRPMAQLLLKENATVTIAHSKTPDVGALTREADIVVVAAGRPQLLGREDFKQGAVVIDVGIHRVNGRLCGDVRFEELEGHVLAATPVPGGVGPMTITMLLKNALTLAQRSLQNKGSR